MHKELDVISSVLRSKSQLAYDARLAESKRTNDPYGTLFPSPGLALQNSQKSYRDHLITLDHKVYSYPNFPLYPFSRSLSKEVDGSQSYEAMLPEWRTVEGGALSVIQLIERLIQQHSEESLQSGVYKPVVIADLGYGNGQALLETAQRWGNKVCLIGYGPSQLTDFTGYDSGTAKDVEPTRAHLNAWGVKLIEGNLINIRSCLIGELTPDLILANHSLQYADYPFWELIKKVYRTVKHGGYVLIAIAPPDYRIRKHAADNRLDDDNQKILKQEAQLLTDQLHSLKEYLNDAEYDFQIDVSKGHIAFRRTAHFRTGYEPPSMVRSAFPAEYPEVTPPGTPEYKSKAEGLYSYGRSYSKKPFFHIRKAFVKELGNNH